MIDWPSRVEPPTPAMVRRVCDRRFGKEGSANAMTTTVVAIYVKEVINQFARTPNMWVQASAETGIKKSALQQAYLRSGRTKWARFLALGMLNELILRMQWMPRERP